MTARLGLAGLLLVAAPLSGAQAPAAVEEAANAAAGRAEATQASEVAAAGAEAKEEAGEAGAAAAGVEVEESFSPTERVPADASIRFPVDI